MASLGLFKAMKGNWAVTLTSKHYLTIGRAILKGQPAERDSKG
jgi:hypothetical protein